MKQAQLKSIVLLTLFAILGILLVLAGDVAQDTPDRTDVTLTSPADNAYYLDESLLFTCNGSAVQDWNITSIALYITNGTSTNGTNWNESALYTISDPLNNTAVGNVFTLTAIPDGIDLIWNCGVNYTNVTTTSTGENKSFFASNRTVNIEYRPSITLNAPKDNHWTNSTSEIINFTVTSTWTSNTGFDCYIYSNTSTLNWTSSTYVRGINKTTDRVGITNTSDTTFTHLFEEGVWNWGIWCAEGVDNNIFNFSTSNFTINVDYTTPVVTVSFIENSTPVQNMLFNKNDISINYTLVEINPLNVTVFINGTGNVTDTGYSGKNNFTIPDISDGVYSLLIQATDMTNASSNSTSYLFTIDTDFPSIDNVQNGTPSGFADRWTINFTSDEDVNYTIYYGTTVGVTSSISSATKTNDIEATLKSLTENTKYYFNITVCDAAGNCNVSGHSSLGQTQYNFSFPFHIYTGWSYFGIYEADITFSRILATTETEYVYYWNQTNQEWIYATAGGSTEQNFELGVAIGDAGSQGRHIVVLYESVNSTWDRNVTNTSYYKYNFTTGDNFIKISQVNMTMGDIAVSLFNNESSCSYGNELCWTPDLGSSWSSNLTYNLTQFYFSGFNNTANTWTIDYIYNWTWNNKTYLNVSSPSEIVWIYSPYNLTWNGSNIIANWTI